VCRSSNLTCQGFYYQGEPDTTSAQEKQEALNAFRETIENIMVKHHTAFLNMFKQMMVGVFGPGMERMLSRVSPQTSTAEVGETSAAQSARDASAQPPPQTTSAKCGESTDPAASTKQWRSPSQTTEPVSGNAQ
jgi:hypothetical protein